jgi:EAL and modified HD-GYP domain-containing signal transduction protein
MDPDRIGTQGFPVFTLQPVADVRHAWVGMVLGIEGGGEALSVSRLFGEFGLADALDPLACVVPWDDSIGDAAAMITQLSPQQAVVLCTGHSGAGLAAEPALAGLQRAGYRLLYQPIPPSFEIPSDVEAIAWDCGTPLSSPPTTVMGRLPGPHLALAVDSYERFELCKATGFSWLAGDYPLHFSSLNFSRGRGPAHTLLLKLLALVVRDADTRDIENVLKQDPQMSFQLLRLVNSAAFAHPTRIATFNQAITMLGRRQLQRWLQLLLYAHPSSDELSSLLPRAAYRARFMEALCQQGGGNHEQQDRAFMTGIFSLLDAIFGRSLTEILQPLDLEAEVVEALLEHRGHLGNLLEIVRIDRVPSTTASIRSLLQAADLDPEKHARAMVEACHWAVRVGRESL